MKKVLDFIVGLCYNSPQEFQIRRIFMLLSKEILLEKAIDVGGSCVCILGITFIILNTFFPIFPNVALANWFAGLAIGAFYCVTGICSNIEEYYNDNYPFLYKVWVLFYPMLFIGTILVLLYGNFNTITTSCSG